MKPINAPANLRWTATQTVLVSLILGILAFLLLRFMRISGYFKPSSIPSDSSNWDVGEFTDLLSLTGVIVALTLPSFILLCLRVMELMRARPGLRAFQDGELNQFRKSFETDRRAVSSIMVPAHSSKAKPAKSSRKIDLGDSLLVIPKSANLLLDEFLGKSKRRKSLQPSFSTEIEKDILMITGEPGAGKSVLLQEIHASLSLGVERGYHSFVPLVIFARDLTKGLLTLASQNTESPMRTLIASCYKQRIESDLADEDLTFLYNLVLHDWEEIDFLVIIDGLDEIAQRSAYEEIQKELARIILIDLKSNLKSVHRYILSCRTDEDLELFPGADTLHLRGLTDEQREEFCRVLIGSGNLDKQLQNELEQALYSPRLTPAHVFRRNPYFLSLLVRHLIDDQDGIRDRKINFDYLMRKYLKREAVRPNASIYPDSYLTVEDRQALFNELEKISRACLQYLAFQSASTARLGALYDQTLVDARLVEGFFNILEDDTNEATLTDLWGTIKRTINIISVDDHITPESMQKLGLARYLHENDIWLLASLSKKIRHAEKLDRQILFEALGAIPYKSILEEEEWYFQLSERFLMTAETMILNHRQKLAVLLFFRSIGAAHVLRILLVNNDLHGTTFRFRHRRLAEYYAACYLRDRWPSIEHSIDFSPWLGPILNLTCALEGVECKVLHKLVDRIIQGPEEPYFKWRYSVEAVVEASFFAEPGYEYERAIKEILYSIIRALWEFGSQAGDLPEDTPNDGNHIKANQTEELIPLDAVTEITALRALVQYSRLKDTIRLMNVLDPESVRLFNEYEATVPKVWMSQVMAARFAVEALTQKRHSLGSYLTRLWKLAQQPGVILSDDPDNALRSFPWLRRGILFTTLLSEVAITFLLIFVIAGMAFFICKLLQLENRDAIQNVAVLSVIILTTRIFFRYVAWQQSRLEAVSTGALLWRAIGGINKVLRNALNGSFKINWRLPIERPSIILVSSIVVALIFGIGTAFQNVIPKMNIKSALVPCPEVNDLKDSIINKYKSLNKSNLDLKAIQQEVRADIESMREVNKKRSCGAETIEGWTLAEDRLADWLAEYDPRLVPSESKDVKVLTLEEINEASEFLSTPLPENPEGTMIGSLKSIYRGWEASRIIEAEKRLYSQIKQARRQGVGLSEGSDYAFLDISDEMKAARERGEKIVAANLFLGDMELLIEQDISDTSELRSRAKQTAASYLVAIIGLGMFVLSIRLNYRRRRDLSELEKISKVSNIRILCEVLLDRNRSERIKRHALGRIDIIGIGGQDDLKVIEDIASQLLKRNSETDQAVGLSVANLARALSNRLRHRVSDTIISKVAGQ